MRCKLVWTERTTTRRLSLNPHGTITEQVVKVVRQKGRIAVFTRWRQYAPPSNMLPWTHLSRHPKQQFVSHYGRQQKELNAPISRPLRPSFAIGPHF